MRFEGTVTILAPRDRAWAFLMDPQKVGGCGPGVESIEVIDKNHFKAKAKVGVGFIRARLLITMEMTDLVAPSHATILAHGQAPGSAVDATAQVDLRDGAAPGTTIADWSADVNISGTLASVGARLIDGTAHKMIDQTFGCIKAKLEA